MLCCKYVEDVQGVILFDMLLYLLLHAVSTVVVMKAGQLHSQTDVQQTL